MTWTPNTGFRPDTGDKKLRVRFRNGEVSKHTYSAKQLVWTNRGEPFDITAWRTA